MLFVALKGSQKENHHFGASPKKTRPATSTIPHASKGGSAAQGSFFRTFAKAQSRASGARRSPVPVDLSLRMSGCGGYQLISRQPSNPKFGLLKCQRRSCTEGCSMISERCCDAMTYLFGCRVITQRKLSNVQNTPSPAKVWTRSDQEWHATGLIQAERMPFSWRGCADLTAPSTFLQSYGECHWCLSLPEKKRKKKKTSHPKLPTRNSIYDQAFGLDGFQPRITRPGTWDMRPSHL